MHLRQKLTILADAAKYDASCASSGARRSGKSGELGHNTGSGICHSYTPDGRCVSLLKILLTNHCIYDCQYCVNRITSNTPRARFTVDEVVFITIEFYKRNYIEGLFLSSGVIQSPDKTMEELSLVAFKLRTEHKFNGYIHLKAVPKASPDALELAGRYADRLSANIELATDADLKLLAPEKKLTDVDATMSEIRHRWQSSRQSETPSPIQNPDAPLVSAPTAPSKSQIPSPKSQIPPPQSPIRSRQPAPTSRPFAPAGQSTQMIVGATPTPDATLLSTASRLYQQHRLRRVYFSAYSPIPHADSRLPFSAPPLVREHRLYQADWLFRFYGFEVAELTTPDQPNLPLDIDPKLAWALRHRHLFPVDINRAPRHRLLRVPGLGVKSVDRILRTRRLRKIRLEDLQRLGVSLTKSRPFLLTSDHNPALSLLDSDRLRDAVAPPPMTQLDLFTPQIETAPLR